MFSQGKLVALAVSTAVALGTSALVSPKALASLAGTKTTVDNPYQGRGLTVLVPPNGKHAVAMGKPNWLWYACQRDFDGDGVHDDLLINGRHKVNPCPGETKAPRIGPITIINPAAGFTNSASRIHPGPPGDVDWLQVRVDAALGGLQVSIGLDHVPQGGQPPALAQITTDDCDGNGIPDAEEIEDGSAPDCNGNGIPDECESDFDGDGIPDECEIAEGTADDCDGNGVVDPLDIEFDFLHDMDENGIADECERPGDLDFDGDVDLSDLATLLSNYGLVGDLDYTDGDIDFDDDVDLADLAGLLAAYGTTGP